MFDGRWRHAVDRTTRPVGRAFVRMGLNADVLTILGLAMSVVTAYVVGTGHFVLGVIMLFPTGLPDLFDGPVAKASGTASVRGAFFDSVADRISDAFLYGGVAWYLAAHRHGTIELLPFAILATTSLISYQRAKAELLGVSAGGGLMERAERFILLGGCFLAGAASHNAFVPALWVFFGLVSATAVGRFLRIWAKAEGPVRPARPQRRSSIGSAELARRRRTRWSNMQTDSRWKALREAIAAREAAPITRLRSRRDGPTVRPGPTWRDRRAAWSERRARLHEGATSHRDGERA
jgi:CDP-diacylglycerol--glycerol-3-phosphate 3-phosphatidyltransferase